MSDLPVTDALPDANTPTEQNAIDRATVTQPDALIADLRDTPADIPILAAADVEPQFRTWLTFTGGFQVRSVLGVGDTDRRLAVEWTIEGRHDKDLALRGLHASNRDVTVRGLTIFESDGRQLQVRRYIDWIGFYAQLGLSINWRLPVDCGEPTDLSQVDVSP